MPFLYCHPFMWLDFYALSPGSGTTELIIEIFAETFPYLTLGQAISEEEQ